jgi:hypothetical protein
VRQGQPLAAELEIAEQEQIEVDRPGAVPRAGERAAVPGLYPLADVEKLVWLERRTDPCGGIEEVGLVEEFSNGLGLVQRRDRLDLNSVVAQVPERLRDVSLAIAEVRPEPDVADARAGPRVAQTPSTSSPPSSSEPRSAARSRVTSTTASSTG